MILSDLIKSDYITDINIAKFNVIEMITAEISIASIYKNEVIPKNKQIKQYAISCNLII